MEKQTHSTTIKAPRERVWEALWNDEPYRQWTSPFCEGSYAVSEWKEGSRVHFLTPDGDGMFSVIDRLIPNEFMSFRHLGSIRNNEEQPANEETKKWEGAMENYRLIDRDGGTEVVVELDADGGMGDFLARTFPLALAKLKELSESGNRSKITVSTVVDAPLEKAWERFTLPEHITQWNFASDDWFAPSSVNDLRVGGTFRNRMEARDGSFGFDFEGEYTDLRDHEHIAYRIADGREVKIDFRDLGDGRCEVTETFDAENEHSEDLQRDGWQSILNNFKKHAES